MPFNVLDCHLKQPTDNQLELATTSSTIMFKCTQRSGALVNVTLDEYERACLVDCMKVIRVSVQAQARVQGISKKLVVQGKNMQRLDYT